MWIAWIAWVVNGTILDFFQCFHCFDGTFHCGVQDFMCLQCSQLHKVKSVARSSFDKKNMCTTNIFGMCKCLCEDFQHFNVCACFVKCVFFGISSLSEFRHLCTTDVKRVSRKTLTWCMEKAEMWIWCWYTFSKQCVQPIYIYVYIYMAQRALLL